METYSSKFQLKMLSVAGHDAHLEAKTRVDHSSAEKTGTDPRAMSGFTSRGA
jgi:hypothetical protein